MRNVTSKTSAMELRRQFRFVLATMILQVCVSSVAGAAEAAAPTYEPEVAWSASGGVIGNLVSDLGVMRTYYTADVAGPFGDRVTAKQMLLNQEPGFGGTLLKDLQLREGADLWIRIYQYFPEDFCFSYGALGDGWGGTKWIRAQTSAGRSTMELGTADPNWNDTYAFKKAPTCGTSTAFYGDINEMGAGNRPFANYGTAQIVRGRWQAIQAHWHFSASGGYIRGWVDDVYLGQNNYATLKTGAVVQEIILGDYWNGGAPKNQQFYYDEIVITTSAPNTLDSGGRPFISPQTSAKSFSRTTLPQPPSGVEVQ